MIKTTTSGPEISPLLSHTSFQNLAPTLTIIQLLSCLVINTYFLLTFVKVNSPSLMRPGSVEQYKRAFARQRARDLAQHADALLWKDKEIAALQKECRDLEARLGTTKVFMTQLVYSDLIELCSLICSLKPYTPALPCS